MKFRSLGRTGLQVSVLGFGGSSLGSVFEQIDEAEGVRAVHTAIDHGINLIDTAPFYGLTKAETVLGKALREIPRASYYLATKVGRYGYAEADFDFSAECVTRSIDESLSRLGVEYVDFIQAHDMEFGRIEQIVQETIPALRRAQAQGKARFVGITCLPLPLFRQVMDQVEVDLIQSYCHYCLNDDSLADCLPYLQSHGVGILNSAPLAMRLLSLEGPPAWHPAPEAVKTCCAEAARFCRDNGADLSKLALQFSCAQPGISANIVGAAQPERILQNIRHVEEPVDPALLARVLEILRPAHNVSWTSGRPENNPPASV